MKLFHLGLLACVPLLAITENCMAQSTMVPWLTRSADNSRSGWNQHETQLTQASVASKGIVRATIIPVIGDARGMEAQPLILPNVRRRCGTRDVMVLPSMADVVRGVDAHDGSGIWQVTLAMPVTGSQTSTCRQINHHWGCLSTGVIDADTQRLYQVCWVSPDKTGNPQTARYFMFVLNVADGTQMVPPVTDPGKERNTRLQRGDAQTAIVSCGDERRRCEDSIWVFGDDQRDSSGCSFRLLLCLRCGKQHGERDAGTDSGRGRWRVDGWTRRQPQMRRASSTSSQEMGTSTV